MKHVIASVAATLLITSACHGPTQGEAESVSPEPAETSAALVDESETSADRDGLARSFDDKYESESRDSAWAGDTEQRVNNHVSDRGGTVRSALVCKTTVCRGSFSFPNKDMQSQVLMGMELGALLGFPHQKLIKQDEGSTDVVLYIVRIEPQVTVLPEK